MWICPICSEQNGGNVICVNCGFDESCNYEKYYILTTDIQRMSVYLKKRRLRRWDAVYEKGVQCLKLGDSENAVEYIRMAAANGNADAQFAYGSIFYGGVEENFGEAVLWFKKAALQGHAMAQYYLGRCYFWGEGEGLDYSESVRWLEKAEKGGCREASRFLDTYVYGCESDAKTENNIMNWYKKLADRGNREIQIYLGDYFYKAYNGPEAYKEAAKWYEKAAHLGSSKAKWKIGSCYYRGQGVEYDMEKAVEYYKMAATEGDGVAQALLGMCYEFGNGVEKNLQKAVEWYREAAFHGDMEAKRRMEILTVDRSAFYDIEDAIDLVKKTSVTKSEETIEAHIKTGCDWYQADQRICGAVVLPHGTGKKVRVLVLAKREKAREALAAGADFAGGEELLFKIQNENWFDYDVIVATPDMMGAVARFVHILGPKGLMPNPRTGTLTMNVIKAVKDIKAGKIEYRLDHTNAIHAPIGKISFTKEQLVGNFRTLMSAVVKAKPNSLKDKYLKSVSIATPMGPDIRLNIAKFL